MFQPAAAAKAIKLKERMPIARTPKPVGANFRLKTRTATKSGSMVTKIDPARDAPAITVAVK